LKSTPESATGDPLPRLYDSMACGVIIWDRAGRISHINQGAEQILRVSRRDVIGQTSLRKVGIRFVAEDGAKLLPEERPSSARLSQVAQLKRTLGIIHDGLEPRWVHSDAVPLLDAEGGTEQVIFSFVDITERKHSEEALAHRALHDGLTGLPNRSLLTDRLDQAITMAKRRGSQCALMMLDLDRFKDVNDTFGHHVGDFALLEAGARMMSALRESDTVARLGGDEFAIVLTEVDGELGAQQAAAKIVEALGKPFFLEGETVDIDASIGISLFPQHGEDGDTLLRHADVAMYVAKRENGVIEIYRDEQDPRSANRLSLKSDLRRAIENDDLVLHFQPKVLLAANRTLLVEALVRWQHPTRGLLAPDHFVPFAEQVGLIRPLTTWVINAALRQCHTWREEGLPVSVAINLSVRNLHDAKFLEIIQRSISDWQLSPEWIKLEVTESMVMNQPERVLRTLNELRRFGFELSIDDFGTGYSSLAYLRHLPVNEIKIDKSFIREMMTNASDDMIVRSTIDLGHNLGLLVVAEGVEDANASDRLKVLGCDAIQGYYIARPMPAEHAGQWLRESPWVGGTMAIPPLADGIKRTAASAA